jgi:glycosidase
MVARRFLLWFLAASLCAVPPPARAGASPISQTIDAGDGVRLTCSLGENNLTIECPILAEKTTFVALTTQPSGGSAVLPFAEKEEGSTVFLPFHATALYSIRGAHVSKRTWRNLAWSEHLPAEEAKLDSGAGVCRLTFPRSLQRLGLVVYSKDFAHSSWGLLSGCTDAAVPLGAGDKYIPHYLELDLTGARAPIAQSKARLGCDDSKVRIYQLFVRLFGNTNETRKSNGTLAENGVGKFNDINEAAITSLKGMGFTHIWLTGILQQATASDYSEIGQPPDDPDLLKGLAGSPYAIRDYFDVSPDYAEKPADRLKEFKALLDRLHASGLKAIIDFVPNHVARSYHSDVQPDSDFGRSDDTSKFFDAQNNFFYLRPNENGPPLKLPTFKDGEIVSPTCKAAGLKCDGSFAPETKIGRVTGNNVVSWTPSLNDWYETVKLNYGFDFTDGTKQTREYPNAIAPNKPVPDTWKKMDRVLASWQSLGVDGFRCDMAHMEPPEFWCWAITRARERAAGVYFAAEAYDNDPAKVPGSDPVIAQLNGGKSNVMFDLLNAGFNAVYDDPTYKALKKIYDGPGWANDLDGTIAGEFIRDNSLRYAENHDEVRLAAASQWGGVGMNVGRPVAAILYGLSRGPVMLYNGQEVGEPGAGTEGFGGDDSRTSIFDYWSMPELTKWVNDHRYDGAKLSAEQRSLREFYARLTTLLGEPAFRDGNFFAVNPANRANRAYGRLGDEQPSGHWLYSFLRYDAGTGQKFLVVVNLNAKAALKDVSVIIDRTADEFLGFGHTDPKSPLILTDRLASSDPRVATSCINEAASTGVWIGDIPPLTPYYFEIVASKP